MSAFSLRENAHMMIVRKASTYCFMFSSVVISGVAQLNKLTRLNLLCHTL